MARGFLRRQPSHHTLQTTELIHEAYLKIANSDQQNWQNRAHFFGVAAKAMRHILVDYARSKQRQKRGGVQERVSLADDIAVSHDQTKELVDLDEVLKALEMREIDGLEVGCRMEALFCTGGRKCYNQEAYRLTLSRKGLLNFFKQTDLYLNH